MLLTVEEAATILRNHGIVGIPTETVYGLAANALSATAVAKVFAAKERPWFDPLIVHLPSVQELPSVAAHIPAIAQKLAQAFWPGPLTLVLSKQPQVPDLVTSGGSTVAVRVPAHPVAQELLRKCGCPVAAPSANLFGKVSPTTAQAVLDQLQGRIDGVVEGGACSVGVESTIIDCTSTPPRLLRPGGIPREAIEALIGPLAGLENPAPENVAMPAPGTCKRHYSPETPIVFLRDLVQMPSGRIGLLAFGPQQDRANYTCIENLSPLGDLCEAATNLYAMMRRLDSYALDAIIVEPIPEEGLGLAINDRLGRAAARS